LNGIQKTNNQAPAWLVSRWQPIFKNHGFRPLNGASPIFPINIFGNYKRENPNMNNLTHQLAIHRARTAMADATLQTYFEATRSIAASSNRSWPLPVCARDDLSRTEWIAQGLADLALERVYIAALPSLWATGDDEDRKLIDRRLERCRIEGEARRDQRGY
jgi:hypothetical protein